MGIYRIFRLKKRLIQKRASTLIETLAAMSIIAIVGLLAVSGIMTSVGIYNAADNLRSTVKDARTQLLKAAKTEAKVEILDMMAPQTGEVTCTGEYQPDRSSSAYVNVYSFAVPKSNGNTILYYYSYSND